MTKSGGSTQHAHKVQAPLIAPSIRSLLGADADVGPDESLALSADEERALAAVWDEEARSPESSATHVRNAKRAVPTKNGRA